MPELLEKQHMDDIVLKKLDMPLKEKDMSGWHDMVERILKHYDRKVTTHRSFRAAKADGKQAAFTLANAAGAALRRAGVRRPGGAGIPVHRGLGTPGF